MDSNLGTSQGYVNLSAASWLRDNQLFLQNLLRKVFHLVTPSAIVVESDIVTDNEVISVLAKRDYSAAVGYDGHNFNLEISGYIAKSFKLESYVDIGHDGFSSTTPYFATNALLRIPPELWVSKLSDSTKVSITHIEEIFVNRFRLIEEYEAMPWLDSHNPYLEHIEYAMDTESNLFIIGVMAPELYCKGVISTIKVS